MFEKFALCTCALGFFMAFPLMVLGRARPANFWLGLFVFSVSCACLAEVALSIGLYRRYPSCAGVFDWPVAAIAPSYYCYVRILTASSPWRSQAIHFLPTILFSAALFLPRFLFPYLQEGEQQFFHVARVIGAAIPLLIGLNLVYAVAVLYRLKQFRAGLQEVYSSTQGRDLQWLTWLTIVIVALLATWVLDCILGGVWTWGLELGRIALLYFVGWYGLRQTPVFTAQDLGTASQAAVTVVSGDELEKSKYSRSGMTEPARQLIGARLAKRNQLNKDYLENDLKLPELADRIGTSSHLLSQYLNQELQCTFFEYINGLRVAEVQRLMQEASNATRSLLDLATAAGFNSKSHFNASFRKVTGTTPSAWRQAHANLSDVGFKIAEIRA